MFVGEFGTNRKKKTARACVLGAGDGGAIPPTKKNMPKKIHLYMYIYKIFV